MADWKYTQGCRARGVSPTRTPIALLTGAVVLVVGFHAANLLYIANGLNCEALTLACPERTAPWSQPDTNSYLRVAEALLEKGLLETSYLSRLPGYPALLAASIRITGGATPVLWLAALLAGAAAAAIAWITFVLTDRTAAALTAVLLFSVWLNAYQFSAQLLTDAPHAFLSVVAFAATLRWREREPAGAAWLAGALWMAAQSLRLTFFPLAVILPLLLWKRRPSGRYIAVSASLCLATAIVPALVIASNHRHHQVWSPSFSSSANLACHAVPRLQEELGMGRFRALRKKCHERFRGMEPAEKIPAQLDHAFAFLGQRPMLAFRSFAHEIGAQTTFPIRPYAVRTTRHFYPAWMTTSRRTLGLFWLCALGGLLVIARRDRGLALFLMATFWLVMIPAGVTHLAGARLRLPLDLLFIPLVVLFVQVVVSAAASCLGWPPDGGFAQPLGKRSMEGGRVCEHSGQSVSPSDDSIES